MKKMIEETNPTSDWAPEFRDPLAKPQEIKRMDPIIKKKWLEALNSGDYQQGREQLHSPQDNTFCCLGVLCDLHAQETGGEWEVDTKMPSVGKMLAYLEYTDILPKVVVEWAGLHEHNPLVFIPETVELKDRDQCAYEVEPGHTCTLATLNDGGAPFTKIAEIIDANF